MTDLDRTRDDREVPTPRQSLGLPIVLGLALLPLGKLVPTGVSVALALVAAALAGALAESNPLLSGGVVAVPLGIAIVIVGFLDSPGLGALTVVAAACYIGVSALAGAAGSMAGESWRDRTSEDPEARARARRGMIILAVGALLFGGPKAIGVISDSRADDKAESLERRLVEVTKANVPFDGFVFTNEPANPIRRAVPDVHMIATGEGANMQAEARWGLSARCVLVQAKGTAVTSRIVDDACGALVGG